MSTAIGTRVCGALGCSRSVDVSPTGIRFARCRDHERQAISNAITGSQPGAVPPLPGRPRLPAERLVALTAVSTTGR